MTSEAGGSFGEAENIARFAKSKFSTNFLLFLICKGIIYLQSACETFVIGSVPDFRDIMEGIISRHNP